MSAAMIRSEKEVGVATGFFYRVGDRRFLVTNRHVVIDEKRGVFPDALRIRVHDDASNLTRNEDVRMPLYDANGHRLLLEHPNYGSDAGVVALDLHGILASRHIVNLIESKSFLPDDIVLGIGEDSIVLGYPLGFYDDILDIPVLRSGMVATPYPAGFKGSPTFLIDARLHEGMSGGPVFTKPKIDFQHKNGSTSIMPGMPKFFLGIVSAAFPPNLADNPLGLSVVWFANLVEQIASQ